ncbi:HAMP domain-containing sensor histidine kinase [uncultured Parabacteroides sp.]|uniref:sensor histidine kinase n=1 Tax=uncultured Parabacteroides sp. TaxID=512312 RepID=UPI00280603D2|nr:HAMP domain-containing sensor histidine kinase [uncultured Parabacteroides sp.]
MKIYYFIITLIICFCVPLQAQNKADNFKQQAQSSFENKDYTKARYLYIQAYKDYANEGKITQAIECGTQAASLYYRENYYQEAFDLCRQMSQIVANQEQAEQKKLYDLRFMITKERLQMYIKLRNAAQAQLQLNTLDNLAEESGSPELSEELLYTKTDYYYIFGQKNEGDAAFNKLISRYREKKEYGKVSECYQNLIAIARKANNTSLMEQTYEKYMVWADSVKMLTAEDKLGALQQKYDSSLQTIQEKESQLSAKQYTIAGLCTLAAILVAALAFLAFLVMRFIILNRKLKKIIRTITEHSEQQTGFIQSISAQMEPTLDEMSKSIAGLQASAPGQAKAIQARVDALKQFGDHIQELSSLENSLLETYEAQSFNVSSFCEKVMEQIKEDIRPGVEVTTDIPKIEIKTNAEQLQRILLHLLRNAATYTTSGKIKLEFKKKGAHICQFIVTDNGPGIPAEKQEVIFKPFTEIKDLADGDGLGLPICSLIASKINGTLSIDPEYKKGSRFILVLQV